MLAGRRIACAVCIDLGGLFLLAHFNWSPLLQLPPFCLLYNYSFPQFICFRLLSNSTWFYPCLWVLQPIICLSGAFVSIYLCTVYNLRHITSRIVQNCWRFWLEPRGRPRPLLAHRFHCSTPCTTPAHVTNLPRANCLQGNSVQVAYTV